MPTRRLFVAMATATALAMSAISMAAGPAAGTPVPEPKPHPRLLGPTHDTATAALIAVKELKQQYATTRLPSAHNAIVLILHSPVSAVL